ncbi:DUF2158 domain-containing protein [Herbaspirillum huttiense]|uniref:DUF2158 domain-containing protein n=1 Tax=Herbaspirillum huttiense TaxID=863372 RepID=UPI00058505AA
MKKIFNIGDLVRLKSGGAVMCVRSLRGQSSVECVWHDQKKPCKEIYPVATLMRMYGSCGLLATD